MFLATGTNCFRAPSWWTTMFGLSLAKSHRPRGPLRATRVPRRSTRQQQRGLDSHQGAARHTCRRKGRRRNQWRRQVRKLQLLRCLPPEFEFLVQRLSRHRRGKRRPIFVCNKSNLYCCFPRKYHFDTLHCKVSALLTHPAFYRNRHLHRAIFFLFLVVFLLISDTQIS